MKSITFGKRLTEVRKDKKISQEEVGKLLGIHDVFIGRYEHEEVKLPIEMAMLKFLEISIEYFFVLICLFYKSTKCI